MNNNTYKIYFENYSIVNSNINDSNILLLKNDVTSELCVQKIIPIHQIDVYNCLIKNQIANTPAIYDIQMHKYFFVILCEYIDGLTLTEYINKIFLKEIAFDTKLFFNHIHTLCNIIGKLQKSKSIIHRDIKPDNIMIDKNNNLYLIDFDAAKFFNPGESEDTHKIGTEQYAAPEQYGFGSSNKATDIFAIGKIISDYSSIANDSSLNKKISPIINRCCKVDYRDRYQSINSLKADLFRAEYGFLSLALPGFRTGNFFHMVFATFIYITLFYCTIINTLFDYNTINTVFFFSFLIFTLVFCNYLNILNFFPPAISKNKVVRYISRFVLALIIPSLIILAYIYLRAPL